MKLHKYLEETIDLLWRHRNSWKQEYNERHLLEYVEYKGLQAEQPVFDYPDYGGLPKRISNRLDGDFVDAIQNAWPPANYKTKSQFRGAVLNYAGMDVKRYVGRN